MFLKNMIVNVMWLILVEEWVYKDDSVVSLWLQGCSELELTGIFDGERFCGILIIVICLNLQGIGQDSWFNIYDTALASSIIITWNHLAAIC